MRKIKWKLEYSITLFVIAFLGLLLLPVSVSNPWQARFISKWNERFNRAEYMFSVIKTHMTDETRASFNAAQTPKDREALMLALVKPYLRIDTSKKVPKRYKIKYMNNSRVMKGQSYFFEDRYFVKDGSIVGIKDVEQINDDEPVFVMMFDLNGLLPPNKWGRDVFGIDIYDRGIVEPFGHNLSMDALVQDCSENGTGISCSYYYKIGGAFED